jgi:hypothetical protein
VGSARTTTVPLRDESSRRALPARCRRRAISRRRRRFCRAGRAGAGDQDLRAVCRGFLTHARDRSARLRGAPTTSAGISCPPQELSPQELSPQENGAVDSCYLQSAILSTCRVRSFAYAGCGSRITALRRETCRQACGAVQSRGRFRCEEPLGWGTYAEDESWWRLWRGDVFVPRHSETSSHSRTQKRPVC